jgi:Fe-Mn family superoxide dismutase
MTYSVPDLPYAYESLNPHVDTETMVKHHDFHHKAYVTNLNNAVSVSEILYEKLIIY